MTLTTWSFVQPPKPEDHPSNTISSEQQQPKWFTEMPVVWGRYQKDPHTFTADEIAQIDKRRLSARLIVANFIAMFDGQIARGNCKNARRRALYLEFMEQTADTTKIQRFFCDVDREQQRLLTSSPASAEPWAAYQHAGMIAACTMASVRFRASRSWLTRVSTRKLRRSKTKCWRSLPSVPRKSKPKQRLPDNSAS